MLGTDVRNGLFWPVFVCFGSISYASKGLYGKERHAESESDVQNSQQPQPVFQTNQHFKKYLIKLSSIDTLIFPKGLLLGSLGQPFNGIQLTSNEFNGSQSSSMEFNGPIRALMRALITSFLY